jgi:hypothetical protein
MSTSVAAHRQIFAGPMGQAAGGKMNQKIYPDSYGIDSWDVQSSVLRPIDEALGWGWRKVHTSNSKRKAFSPK